MRFSTVVKKQITSDKNPKKRIFVACFMRKYIRSVEKSKYFFYERLIFLVAYKNVECLKHCVCAHITRQVECG